jgi:hypothetical protein
LKKIRWVAILFFLMIGIACSPTGMPILDAPSTALPDGESIPDDISGYMLTTISAEEVAPFLGSWQGNISGFDFQIHINREGDLVSATLDIGGGTEQLFVLSTNETTIYFFRHIDNACLSMYVEGNDMKLEYYERGAPRIISVTRV